jgi:hypothetical protein
MHATFKCVTFTLSDLPWRNCHTVAGLRDLRNGRAVPEPFPRHRNSTPVARHRSTGLGLFISFSSGTYAARAPELETSARGALPRWIRKRDARQRGAIPLVPSLSSTLRQRQDHVAVALAAQLPARTQTSSNLMSAATRVRMSLSPSKVKARTCFCPDQSGKRLVCTSWITLPSVTS